jgi:dUTP pyrophosphatase
MKINFKKLNKNAEIPNYATIGSAGADLKACIDREIVLSPQKIEIIPTGITIEIPKGFFGMVCPRSGLASKHGITLINSPGILDSDYRGELKLLMINHSSTPFSIENGMRVAQLIIVPFQKVEWIEREELTDTVRGTGGIGSTGIRCAKADIRAAEV